MTLKATMELCLHKGCWILSVLNACIIHRIGPRRNH
jgi:hypothetical protein